MTRVKYIKTKQNQIIAFSELLDHADFKEFEPVSAGFISFGIDASRSGFDNPTCACFGRSVTLKMANHPADTDLAKKQLLGLGDYY